MSLMPACFPIYRVDLVTDEEEKFEFYTGGDADETSSTHRALSPASSG